MLNAPQIIQLCDHTVRKTETGVELEKITRSDQSIDVIDTDIHISEIMNIFSFSLMDDTTQSYYEDFDFTMNGKDIIWSGQKQPALGQSYYVQFSWIKLTTEQYVLDECPKCAGNNWFVDLFGVDGDKTKKVSGIGKMVQDYIKVLLTVKNGDYGTDLMSVVGSDLSDEGTLVSQINSIVLEAENQCKNLQKTDIFAGELMEPEEKLRSAITQSIEIDAINSGVMIAIVLVSESNNAAQLELQL